MQTPRVCHVFLILLASSPPATVAVWGGEQAIDSHHLSAKESDVDESKRIPDDVAYRHLLTGLASSDQLPASERDRIRIRIAKIGLSPRDSTYLEVTLMALEVRDSLARIASDRHSLNVAVAARSQTAIAKLQLLRTEEDDLIRFAKSQVIQGLTQEGVAILDRYVQEIVKPQITIIRGDHTP